MKTLSFRLLYIVIAILIGGNHLCAQSQFSKNVESQLSSFENKSDARFLNDDYDILKQRISYFYSQNKLSLDDNLNFNRRLYAAYMSKFLNRSFKEVNGSEWNIDTLKFIRKEIEKLTSEGRRDGLYEDNSISGNKIKNLKKIFSDYDKVNRFIASTKKFSYDEFSVNDTFPIVEIQKVMKNRDKFLNKNSYPYTTKCQRLNDELNSVTKTLFNAHVKYLDSKLEKLSECYKETQTTAAGVDSALYASQPVYRELYYDVMKVQLQVLKKKTNQDSYIYRGCDVIKEYGRLIKKLDDQNDKAYEYFESKNENE